MIFCNYCGKHVPLDRLCGRDDVEKCSNYTRSFETQPVDVMSPSGKIGEIEVPAVTTADQARPLETPLGRVVYHSLAVQRGDVSDSMPTPVYERGLYDREYRASPVALRSLDVNPAHAKNRLVVVESPFAGLDAADRQDNIDYARACIRDSLLRGECPIASHLLYTQPGILDDDLSDERAMGIRAGLAWLRVASASVCYFDRGISTGMSEGLKAAREAGVPIIFRRFGAQVDTAQIRRGDLIAPGTWIAQAFGCACPAIDNPPGVSPRLTSTRCPIHGEGV